VHARGTAAIDAVRASGDEPLLAQLLFRCALTFHDRDADDADEADDADDADEADEADDLALEAIALGERVGVGAIIGVARRDRPGARSLCPHDRAP